MRKLAFLLFATLLALASLAGEAYAQIQSFNPTGGTTLAVSNVSSRVAFATAGPTVVLTNTGSVAAFVKFGSSTVTATTANWLINPGCSVAYDVNGQGFVAAITSASTTTLTVVTGGGIPSMPGSGCSVAVSGGTITAVSAAEAPVAPGAATATKSLLAGCQNLTTPPTYANTNQGALLCGTKGGLYTSSVDPNGNIIDTTLPVGVNPVGCSTSACGIVTNASTAVESGHIICASACNSYDIAVTTGASAVNLMVFNATAVPGDGAVTPKRCEVVPANSTYHLGTNGSPPSWWNTGLSVAISTAAGSAACLTKTASATGFFSWKVSP